MVTANGSRGKANGSKVKASGDGVKVTNGHAVGASGSRSKSAAVKDERGKSGQCKKYEKVLCIIYR